MGSKGNILRPVLVNGTSGRTPPWRAGDGGKGGILLENAATEGPVVMLQARVASLSKWCPRHTITAQ